MVTTPLNQAQENSICGYFSWGTDERRQSVALQQVSHITCKSCLPEMMANAEYCRILLESPMLVILPMKLVDSCYSIIPSMIFCLCLKVTQPCLCHQNQKRTRRCRIFRCIRSNSCLSPPHWAGHYAHCFSVHNESTPQHGLNVERSQDLETSRRAYPGPKFMGSHAGSHGIKPALSWIHNLMYNPWTGRSFRKPKILGLLDLDTQKKLNVVLSTVPLETSTNHENV